LLKAARDGPSPELEARALAEAKRDEAAHAEALKVIEAEQRVALIALEKVTDATVDLLARRALARAIGGGSR
jgi:hypothetical protein